MSNTGISRRRRAFTQGLLALPAASAVVAPTVAQKPKEKVLRYAFRVAETGFDPAQITDLYSATLCANIFDAPLEFAYLARPIAMRPNTAEAMPVFEDDYRRLVIRLRPGIYFADDPAFDGKRRELTAADYVYAIKRHYDPRWKSGRVYLFENAGLLELSEMRQQAIKGAPFDYDRVVAGARVLDRYVFELRFAQPQPRFPYQMADAATFGAVAREVVERYGDAIMAHPVGTGPFKLAEWKRSSRIVLVRNPDYRERFYEEQPPADDREAVEFAAQLKGRRLPMIDRVEVSIIEENQPRWLAFLNQQHDFMDELPADFAPQVIPNNRLAPNLARLGMKKDRYPRADIAMSYFAMENPVVGGYTPEKVALRRAISLAVDVEREIALVRRGQAIPAQSLVGPQTWGYDREFVSEMSLYSPTRAKALLDTYGYVDRDGDGWREQPDGSPLLLEYSTQPDQQSRQLIEQWKRNMDAIGIRIEFKPAQWPENLKASRAGKLMMWGVGWVATTPDADDFLGLGYGPNKGQANHARFDLPAYNRAYLRQRELPDGAEREALIAEAKRLMVAYMPYKVHVHRYFTDLSQPWLIGSRRNIFARDFWKYLDIDQERLAQA